LWAQCLRREPQPASGLQPAASLTRHSWNQTGLERALALSSQGQASAHTRSETALAELRPPPCQGHSGLRLFRGDHRCIPHPLRLRRHGDRIPARFSTKTLRPNRRQRGRCSSSGKRFRAIIPTASSFTIGIASSRRRSISVSRTWVCEFCARRSEPPRQMRCASDWAGAFVGSVWTF